MTFLLKILKFGYVDPAAFMRNVYIFFIDYLVTGYLYFLFFVELISLLEKSSKLTKPYPMVCSGYFSCFRFLFSGFA